MPEWFAHNVYFIHGGVLPYFVVALGVVAVALAALHAVHPRPRLLLAPIPILALMAVLGGWGYRRSMDIVASATRRVPERLQSRLQHSGQAEAQWQYLVPLAIFALVLLLIVVGQVRHGLASRPRER